VPFLLIEDTNLKSAFWESIVWCMGQALDAVITNNLICCLKIWKMQVHCDASIAFPLVVAATFARKVHGSK